MEHGPLSQNDPGLDRCQAHKSYTFEEQTVVHTHTEYLMFVHRVTEKRLRCLRCYQVEFC